MTWDEADQIQRVFADWAEQEPSCRALALVGSWARGTARTDSDLDLVALVDRLDRWAADDAWLWELGRRLGFPVTRLDSEVYGMARSWRVWFGPEIEFEVTLADIGWACVEPLDQGTRRVVGDGMKSLVDKDGLLRSVEAAANPES